MSRPDADELVQRLILRRYREDVACGLRLTKHLASCPDVEVVNPKATNGRYSCDTGCEYAGFEATIRCPHVNPVDYEWGDFGDIDMCIREMIREEERERNPPPPPPPPPPLIEYVRVPRRKP